MIVEVVKAAREDEPVLRKLLQLYAYDFSEITGGDVGEQGEFEHEVPLDRYWPEPDRHAFLAKADGKLAGFALIRERSALSDDPETTDVVEFFVMRKYRRQGVGRTVATRLFELFPGRWEVREMRQNVAAHAFWRNVIGRYTGGRYEERLIEDERWHGPVQFFEAPAGR